MNAAPVHVPAIEIIADGPIPDVLARLLRVCAKWCLVRARDPRLGRPDATVAVARSRMQVTTVLEGSDAPCAIWVVGEEFNVQEVEREFALPTLARVLLFELGTGAQIVGQRALGVSPRERFLGDHACVPPFIRARWRRRLGLDENFTIRVGVPDGSTTPDEALVASLAVAAAAVVRGEWLPVALMLGTPVVTDKASVDALGIPAEGVCVVADEVSADEALIALIESPERVAALSRAASRFAREHLDLGYAARNLMHRLGLARPGLDVRPWHETGLANALDAMNAPCPALIRERALALSAPLFGSY